MADFIATRGLRLVSASIFATWGIVAAIIPGFGWLGALGAAFILAAVCYCLSDKETVPVALGYALVGAIGAGLFIALLLMAESDSSLRSGGPGYIIYAVAGFGFVLGIGVGLLSKNVYLPTVAFFRKEFLETCVFAGLLAGFLILPFRGFLPASGFATDTTFGLALLGAALFLPVRLGGLAGLKLRDKKEAKRS